MRVSCVYFLLLATLAHAHDESSLDAPESSAILSALDDSAAPGALAPQADADLVNISAIPSSSLLAAGNMEQDMSAAMPDTSVSSAESSANGLLASAPNSANALASEPNSIPEALPTLESAALDEPVSEETLNASVPSAESAAPVSDASSASLTTNAVPSVPISDPIPPVPASGVVPPVPESNIVSTSPASGAQASSYVPLFDFDLAPYNMALEIVAEALEKLANTMEPLDLPLPMVGPGYYLEVMVKSANNPSRPPPRGVPGGANHPINPLDIEGGQAAPVTEIEIILPGESSVHQTIILPAAGQAAATDSIPASESNDSGAQQTGQVAIPSLVPDPEPQTNSADAVPQVDPIDVAPQTESSDAGSQATAEETIESIEESGSAFESASESDIESSPILAGTPPSIISVEASASEDMSIGNSVDSAASSASSISGTTSAAQEIFGIFNGSGSYEEHGSATSSISTSAESSAESSELPSEPDASASEAEPSESAVLASNVFSDNSSSAASLAVDVASGPASSSADAAIDTVVAIATDSVIDMVSSPEVSDTPNVAASESTGFAGFQGLLGGALDSSAASLATEETVEQSMLENQSDSAFAPETFQTAEESIAESATDLLGDIALPTSSALEAASESAESEAGESEAGQSEAGSEEVGTAEMTMASGPLPFPPFGGPQQQAEAAQSSVSMSEQAAVQTIDVVDASNAEALESSIDALLHSVIEQYATQSMPKAAVGFALIHARQQTEIASKGDDN
ncbi:hypothetical protein GGI07_000527 [Coemansia sp. Benny D115]|nr:hypothetical protein GGI07_000527 [Coemansia sp. Benny D115]